ncbi:hypothetical protein O181_073445 [Austropuccinia psidii MF-1]|uniref:Uncharacterized protein n=1 Tax=Austropuccinia psidii MF-1 TaxID=1389203 RepID=A0A9Q3F2I2_9BASI|nr:hypothetical protein [Austropuccinia psidii MF-1]
MNIARVLYLLILSRHKLNVWCSSKEIYEIEEADEIVEESHPVRIDVGSVSSPSSSTASGSGSKLFSAGERQAFSPVPLTTFQSSHHTRYRKQSSRLSLEKEIFDAPSPEIVAPTAKPVQETSSKPKQLARTLAKALTFKSGRSSRESSSKTPKVLEGDSSFAQAILKSLSKSLSLKGNFLEFDPQGAERTSQGKSVTEDNLGAYLTKNFKNRQVNESQSHFLCEAFDSIKKKLDGSADQEIQKWVESLEKVMKQTGQQLGALNIEAEVQFGLLELWCTFEKRAPNDSERIYSEVARVIIDLEQYLYNRLILPSNQKAIKAGRASLRNLPWAIAEVDKISRLFREDDLIGPLFETLTGESSFQDFAAAIAQLAEIANRGNLLTNARQKTAAVVLFSFLYRSQKKEQSWIPKFTADKYNYLCETIQNLHNHRRELKLYPALGERLRNEVYATND